MVINLLFLVLNLWEVGFEMLKGVSAMVNLTCLVEYDYFYMSKKQNLNIRK